MKSVEKIDFISNWIKDYATKANVKSLVIGISGGIDSAVTSTLSAMTGLNTYVVTMPILDHQVLNQRAINHVNWLKNKFSNIKYLDVNLSNVFNDFKNVLGDNNSEHGYAN